MKRWWSVAVVLGLGLVVAVVASAATAAPQAFNFRRRQLSDPANFAAYPDVASGAGGLLVAAWTEGDPESGSKKHVGPLKLGWVSDSSDGWQTMTVDTGDVYDVAVAVSGSTVHLAWSREKTVIRYTSCNPPTCGSLEPAAAGEDALQVDIAVDGNGTPYIVWVETVQDTKKVYYTRKEGPTSWRAKDVIKVGDPIPAPVSDDSEGPAITFANNFLHVVWTKWENVENTNSEVRYCRWDVVGGDWSCTIPLADWDDISYPNYLARNLSVAADVAGNVYVVWDIVSADDTGTEYKYAIGYKHSGDDGASWKEDRTYPDGSEFGSQLSGAELFESGDEDRFTEGEYVAYLRPRVSLAVSGTATVPVLVWHARPLSGGGQPELAEANASTAFKVYWTYATVAGSDENGNMFWASDYVTLSADLCGVVDMNVDSTTGSLAVVGDLNDVKHGSEPDVSSYLHTVYHEEIGGNTWGVIYNNNVAVACQRTYLPVIMRNASGAGGGG